MTNNYGGSMGGNNDETRRIDRVPGAAKGAEETTSFPAAGGEEPRPRQVFPDYQQAQNQNQAQPTYQQSQPAYQQPAYQQPTYQQPAFEEEPPRSYDPPAAKSGGGAVGILGALLALALIAAAALGFMYYSASNRDVAPVTTTVTTTAVETTTAKETTTDTETVTTTVSDSRGDSRVPTELPTEWQDRLDGSQGDLEDLLNEMFGGTGDQRGGDQRGGYGTDGQGDSNA